ncbi:SUMF1/EgtB/PvdO family nonheme iron enzyme [Streptomyces sp. MP131-18]|uniref:SUMF1/EgtB/PvdO family nonheme iron enzyme n=1 Tax=Streptomyces sp. MP131-18 TaxID=1857892 RepID=UPI0009A20DE0|nr:SUMF1/EgtB/PvdO family nonheme iron enzyme [Streptomyces sp. MP131-18]
MAAAASARRTPGPGPDGRPAREQVTLRGGTFLMGDHFAEGYHADAEGPVRQVRVAPFRIDTTAVTNAAFAAFADATGYVTDAERFGSSFVFHLLLAPGARRHVLGRVPQAPWWLGVAGAHWRAPEGPGSDLGDRASHPVVHMSHDDALAYCAWAGARLPTEAEWEYAARGGAEGLRYPWGDELAPGGREMCNIWQGDFPRRFRGTPARPRPGTVAADAYEPNGFGLFNTSGNVWEWCADWFAPGQKAIRGGSYLCHASYCNRYRVAARSHNTPDSSTGHGGFRCVQDAAQDVPPAEPACVLGQDRAQEAAVFE